MRRKGCTQGGATLVEAAVALPVFLLLLFCLIDFGRLVAAQVLLLRGAQQAADLAAKIVGFDAPPYEAATNRLAEYTEARNRLLATAQQLPLVLFGDMNSGS